MFKMSLFAMFPPTLALQFPANEVGASFRKFPPISAEEAKNKENAEF